MIWLAAAMLTAATAQNPQAQPSRASAEARATVRILSGVRLSLNGEAKVGSPAPTERTIQLDGVAQTARLIEFQ